MKWLQIYVLYLDGVVVWDGVRTTMLKNQNRKWTELNLMDQDDPEAIKEQSKQLGRILYSNSKKYDLEHGVRKLTHLTKFQGVILFGWLKRYKDIFGGNICERTGPLVYIPLKDKENAYNSQDSRITFIHFEAFNKHLDILVVIDLLPKINRS